MEKRFTFQQIVVFTGGLLGLIAGVVLGLGRFGVLLFQQAPAVPQPPPGDALVGQAAFLLLFTLPFVLSLLALRTDGSALRSIIWIGAGLLALLGAMAAFSGIALYLLPLPGVLLLVGGGMAFVRPEVDRPLLVVGLALMLVIAGGAAFITLFTQENPVCWNQVRIANGADVWQRSPEGVTPVTSQTVPANPGPGDIVRWSCVSDVIVDREGWTSLAILSATLVGLFAVSRWRLLVR